MAAQLWIRALIHDTSAAVLLHAKPFLERLDALIATATATFAETLDESERATAILHLQNAAAVADQASEQVAGGHRSPSAAAPVFVDVEPGWLSAEKDDGEEVTYVVSRKARLCGPQLQHQLSRLHDGTHLRQPKTALQNKGAWHEVARIEDLCDPHVSHKWICHLDSCAGSVLAPLEHDDTCSTSEATRGHCAFVNA